MNIYNPQLFGVSGLFRKSRQFGKFIQHANLIKSYCLIQMDNTPFIMMAAELFKSVPQVSAGNYCIVCGSNQFYKKLSIWAKKHVEISFLPCYEADRKNSAQLVWKATDIQPINGSRHWNVYVCNDNLVFEKGSAIINLQHI